MWAPGRKVPEWKKVYKFLVLKNFTLTYCHFYAGYGLQPDSTTSRNSYFGDMEECRGIPPAVSEAVEGLC